MFRVTKADCMPTFINAQYLFQWYEAEDVATMEWLKKIHCKNLEAFRVCLAERGTWLSSWVCSPSQAAEVRPHSKEIKSQMCLGLRFRIAYSGSKWPAPKQTGTWLQLRRLLWVTEFLCGSFKEEGLGRNNGYASVMSCSRDCPWTRKRICKTKAVQWKLVVLLQYSYSTSFGKAGVTLAQLL